MAGVGTVKFKEGKAELKSDGKWVCDKKDIEEILNIEFNPNDVRGIDLVSGFGITSVENAARFLKGTAQFTNPPKPLKEGEIS